MRTRRDKFIEGVLQGKPAYKAAEDAGYTPGKSARIQSTRLLANVDIQQRIQARIAESKVVSNEVIGTLASQMRGDLTRLLPEEDEVRQRAEREGMSHLIKKLKVRRRFIPNGEDGPIEEVTHEMELYSSQEAAKTLSTILGLAKEPAKNPYDFAKESIRILLEKYPELTFERAKMIVAETHGVEVDQISDAIS